MSACLQCVRAVRFGFLTFGFSLVNFSFMDGCYHSYHQLTLFVNHLMLLCNMKTCKKFAIAHISLYFCIILFTFILTVSDISRLQIWTLVDYKQQIVIDECGCQHHNDKWKYPNLEGKTVQPYRYLTFDSSYSYHVISP